MKLKIIIIAVVVVLLIIFGVFLIKANYSKKQTNNTSSPTISKDQDAPLLLKNISVNLDYYNPVTQKAGDFYFTTQKQEFNRIFLDYGFIIPASSASAEKANPQPAFSVPMGTKVVSMVDGVVVNVSTLYSGDYTIQMAKSENSMWRVETEHVLNPKVKIGDTVTAGQEIAEVSDFWQKNSGLGLVEIGIVKSGTPPSHVCPFQYLDDSVKNDIFDKIRAFYSEWEKFVGDNSLYSDNYQIPGCLLTEDIEG